MDDLLLRVVERLIGIRSTLGPFVYRDAARRALLGIAVAAHVEAERRAGHRCRPGAAVVRFPLARVRSAVPDDGDDDDGL
jgi:hypothetical protein